MSQPTPANATDRQAAIAHLQEMVKEIRTAMLTTMAADGHLHSRPMETARSRFDGDLWFFTAADAPKVAEIAAYPQVNVSYAAPDSERYVSLAGPAALVVDRQRLELLWTGDLLSWFPRGLNDSQLALLQIRVEQAEYWDASLRSMVSLSGLWRALTPGEPAASTDHARVDWPRP